MGDSYKILGRLVRRDLPWGKFGAKVESLVEKPDAG